MNKKFIVPIFIGLLICSYLIFFLFNIVDFGFFSIFTVVATITIISLIILTVYLVKQRIDEIKGGEEDDISKY